MEDALKDQVQIASSLGGKKQKSHAGLWNTNLKINRSLVELQNGKT